jgi:hypothetical protein
MACKFTGACSVVRPNESARSSMVKKIDGRSKGAQSARYTSRHAKGMAVLQPK